MSSPISHPGQLTWLITGSSSGFGLNLVRVALSAGHNVIATSRIPPTDPSPLHDLTISNPSRCRWLALDVTSPSPIITTTIATAESLFGGIDILVNNAGYSLVGAVEDVSEAAARAQLETNFFGPLKVTQATLPGMRECCHADGRERTVVQISSGAGILSRPGLGMYAASKHAFEAMSESMAAEVGPLGINVLIVEPGVFKTDFLKKGGVFSELGEAYQGGAVGQTMEYLKKIEDGDADVPGGDPEKAAKAIFDVVMGTGSAKGNKKVLRLLLGKDAVDGIRGWLKKTEEEIAAVEDISLSTK